MSQAAAQPAPRAELGPDQRDLLRKAELEVAMLAAPDDAALRTSYFDHLGRLAISHTGLLTACLPELGLPLFFRTGTPDIAVLASVFRDHAMAFEMRPTPLRILVIGAYAGYTSIDLARRYPRAEILAVEPLPDNFRLLMLNVTPWRRIRPLNIALWHHVGRLTTNGRVQADWVVRLNDGGEIEDRAIPATTVEQLLVETGWENVDFVVCDASGCEREIFANPFTPWLYNLDAALVRIHEHAAPGAQVAVLAAMDAELFERRKQGDSVLFVRRVPLCALPPAPEMLPLLRDGPGLTPFGLGDVAPNGSAFFIYDGSSCQLHPNPPGHRPARAVFTVRLSGQTRFVAGVRHAGRDVPPVLFSAAVGRDDGTVLGRGDVVMLPGQRGRLQFEVPALSEPARVVLQTQMAPGAETHAMAWARWLDPRLE